ncbi:MAG: hypothetical protein PHR84_02420 [Candidatus Omnitrophica bacterium]|jgi:hypothetical protein|nr:hypothetical protein [Candidatus Omnitrophota bacterium]MDD5660533.1 hypothetical protein [Candidatus Omnitrophota bacterium]
MKKRAVPLLLAVLLLLPPPHLLQAGNNFAANKQSKEVSVKPAQEIPRVHKKSNPNISDADAMSAEVDFYLGNHENSERILKGLKDKHDRNFALWSNNLASLYLSEGRNKEARESLTDAFLLMNNFDAFKNLEAKALGITGNEASKAYKGDPYEKVLNSLYLGLLLIDEDDLGNAAASFKNGILCDSDVEGDLYKSDVAPLYLLAARTQIITGNQALADEYLKTAKDAYYLSHPTNRQIVWEEQILQSKKSDAQKELKKLLGDQPADAKEAKKASKKTEKKIDGLKSQIEALDNQIKEKTALREENNKKITLPNFNNFLSQQNNVILCIETGKAPLKVQTGTYGEKAIFRLKPYKAKRFSVLLDKHINIDKNCFLNNNDILYQAETRGGRKMDGILKGKANFKETTAKVSTAFMEMSAIAATTTAFSGSGDSSVAGLAVTGAFLVAGLVMAATSAAANPSADARHWSYLPAEIQIIPFSAAAGKHHVSLISCDDSGRELKGMEAEFDIEVKNTGTTVIFKRIFERV